MRAGLLCSVLFALFNNASAGEPVVLWSSQFSSSGESIVSDAVALPSGGYVAVGDIAVGQSGNRALNVCELDKDGIVLWEHTALSLGNSSGNSILKLSDGYAVCGVRSDSTGDNGLILKTDLSGNTVWSLAIGYEGDDTLLDMCLSPSGDIIAVGYSFNSETSDNDILAVCVSDSGTVVWQKRYVYPDYQAAYSVVPCTDSASDYVLTGSDGGDVFLMRIDGMGNWQWKTKHFMYGVQMGRNVTGVSDGGYIVAGSTREGNGFSDALLVFFDQDGMVVRDFIWGSVGPDNACSVLEVPPAGYVVLVNTNSGMGEGYRPSLVRFDPWLSEIWSVQISDRDALCYSLSVNESGGFFVTGKASSSLGTTGYSACMFKLSPEDLLNWD
jgi:hypothetical protein